MINVSATLETEQFLLGEDTFRVSATLVTELVIKDTDVVVWTIFGTEDHSLPIKHSRNTEEYEYLSYANRLNPLIEVKTPYTNMHTITVRSKVYITDDFLTEIEVVSLDANGAVVRETVSDYATSTYEGDSLPLTLGAR